jgi:hypothetical protein
VSDAALRLAERALTAQPFDRAPRDAYAVAWVRAGRPLPRDPRRDPRPGDVVSVLVPGLNCARCHGTGQELGGDGVALACSHPDCRGGRLLERVDRLVLVVRTDMRGNVVEVTWRPWSLTPPVPVSRPGQAWAIPTRLGERRQCQLGTWRRTAKAGEVRWAEPIDWTGWQLEPSHYEGRGCACRDCRAALDARIASTMVS